jgi:serine/threonine protein kinase
MASDTPGGLFVNLDEEVIGHLHGKDLTNIIRIHDAWKEHSDPEIYCIMMACAGTSLRMLLNQGFAYSGRQWFDVMRGVANGLSQAHQWGIIHGDLTPSNGKYPTI